MVKPTQRLFALISALLFLATSSILTVAVILQIRDENKQKQQSQIPKEVQDQLNQQEALKKAQSNVPTQEGKLQGTKLTNFTPVPSVSSLQPSDITVGTGAEAAASSTITFHYTGALANDGTIFQSSHDSGQPATYPLSQLIPGWQQGIPGMKVGGKRRLLIPAALGYGEKTQDGIPANSDLVFDIELVEVK